MDRPGTFEQILADYLTAVEAGTAPPLADLLARHPEQAADLSEFFTLRRDFDALVRPRADWADAPEFPLAFGEYVLLRELAAGGMGLVFEARHAPTGRSVALKVLPGGRFASADERRRFRTEAEACLALDHPGIVPVYDVGEADRQPYFTMRLMTGGSLADRRADRAPDLAAAVRLVADLAAAVDHAHRRGILHRDLKPSNVLFDGDGRAYLSDFGLAKRMDAADLERTRTGVAVGTPAYMAPEQAAGRPDAVTVASDVYGLGALLFFALTGRPPFDATRPEPEPIPPSRYARAVPRDLEGICLTCLAADPSRRYASAADLSADLHRFLVGEPVLARRTGLPERIVRLVRRNPVASGLTAVAIAGLLAAGFFAYQDYDNTRRLNADLVDALKREERHRAGCSRPTTRPACGSPATSLRPEIRTPPPSTSVSCGPRRGSPTAAGSSGTTSTARPGRSGRSTVTRGRYGASPSPPTGGRSPRSGRTGTCSPGTSSPGTG